jgi:hypothetical protein
MMPINNNINRVPRHSIFKDEDIYECRACGKRYTDLMIDHHIDKCEKMEEFLVYKEGDIQLGADGHMEVWYNGTWVQMLMADVDEESPEEAEIKQIKIDREWKIALEQLELDFGVLDV